MDIVNLLNRFAPNKIFAAIMLSILSGALSSLVLPLLSRSVAIESAGLEYVAAEETLFFGLEIVNYRYALLFTTCVFAVLISRLVSSILITIASVQLAAEIRGDTYNLLKNTPTLVIESIGPSKITAMLNTDIPAIISASRLFPQILTSFAMLITFLLFLAYIDMSVFRFSLAVIIVGVISSLIIRRFSLRSLQKARIEVDNMQQSVEGLIGGFKQLKQNKRAQEYYFDNILSSHNASYVQAQKKGQVISAFLASYGRLLYYFSIGSVVFIYSAIAPVQPLDLLLIIVILLLIQMPVATLLSAIGQFFSARVSIKNMSRLREQLEAEGISDAMAEITDWDRIVCDSVRFNYRKSLSAKGDGFGIGPIDLEFKRGEVAFVVGGNGSGKSTLGKVVSLQYRVDSGQVYFGNNKVTGHTTRRLRQEICSVFSDNYMFDRLLGETGGTETDGKVQYYLSMMGLDKVVQFSDKKFIGARQLSAGQKKRLALIVALVEDKEVYIFDEWAADQDRDFKKFFYTSILNNLKTRNKVVIVITHDDEYFHLADKIVKMQEGQILSCLRGKTDTKIASI